MSNREPAQELLRRRDVLAWQNIPRSELDSWCYLHPEIVFVKQARRQKRHRAQGDRGCGRYYRKSVIKVKIMGLAE